MDYKERCDFVVGSIISSPDKFQMVMDKFFDTDPKKELEYVHKYDEINRKIGQQSATFWSEETAKVFVDSFSPELLEDVVLLLLETSSEEAINRWDYVHRLEDVSKLEIDYYLKNEYK